MGQHIADNYLQRACFVVAIVGAAAAILATALRFVAARRSSRKPGWEDYFAIMATLFFIFYVVPFLYILALLDGRPLTDLSADELVALTKAGYVMAAQFCPQQLFVKLSLLALYYRIFNASRPFVLCVYVVGAAQLGWSVATYIAHWLECTPPQKLWDSTVPGTCLNAALFLVIGETINSLLDFVLVGLAIWIVKSLQMKTSVKLKLSVIFGLGGLAGVLGFVKIAQGFSQMSSYEIALYDPLWATVQQACGVVCCCAPVYRPLVPSLGLFSKIRSLSSLRLGRRSGASRSGEAAIEEARLPLDSLQVGATTWDQGADGSYHSKEADARGSSTS